MKWTDIKSGQTNGAFQRFMVALGENAEAVITRINTEPVFTHRLAEYAINGCIDLDLSVSHDKEREIMGKNFFGVPEAMKHFGISPTRQQLLMLSKMPFSIEELIMCKDTHILVAVFPLSIRDIRIKTAAKNFFYEQGWYDEYEFGNDKGEASWQLISKTPVTNSIKENWDWNDLLPLIASEEEVPTAQIIIYSIIGHYFNTEERLFDHYPVYTSSLVAENVRVVVWFEYKGPVVSKLKNGGHNGYSNLGILVARKRK